MTGQALQEVLGLELLLLDPRLRVQPEQVAELLHADFVEYGASGRARDRASILAALAADPGVTGDVRDMQAVQLGEGLVQVRYRLGESLRSSLWLWDGLSWRMYFHQGTPTPHR